MSRLDRIRMDRAVMAARLAQPNFRAPLPPEKLVNAVLSIDGLVLKPVFHPDSGRLLRYALHDAATGLKRPLGFVSIALVRQLAAMPFQRIAESLHLGQKSDSYARRAINGRGGSL